MPYVIAAQITSLIPASILNDALDDDGDGNADNGLLTQIISDESQKVEAYLSGIYTTPFPDPAPAPVREAARIFVLAAIYDRRPTEAKNPWSKMRDWWTQRLQKIGNRELPLDASAEGAPVAAAMAGSAVPVPGRLSVNTPTQPVAPTPVAGSANEVFED